MSDWALKFTQISEVRAESSSCELMDGHASTRLQALAHPWGQPGLVDLKSRECGPLGEDVVFAPRTKPRQQMYWSTPGKIVVRTAR